MAAMMRGELLDDLIDALAAKEEEDGLNAALAEAEAQALASSESTQSSRPANDSVPERRNLKS